jgi:hypothetical protein
LPGALPFQLLPGAGLIDNPILAILIFYIPFIFLFFYSQRIQTFFILNEVGRSLNRLRVMKDRSRKEAIDFVASTFKPGTDPTERIDQFLEYFTILPVDIDPAGVVKKIEHTVTVRDDRMRAEVRNLAPTADPVQASTTENLLEAATALNFIYKVVRHFYLLGKRTSSLFYLIQLQMIMPIILQEADALMSAIDAFKLAQPIGDGVGAMVAGRLMLEREKKVVARDTVLSEGDYKGRPLYLIKAEGPSGNVGQPGTALEKLVSEMGVAPQAIIMVDAALKLEGEKTGEVAEGIGAAIGGIGVDRFKIEEVATKHGIPLYAVVIKESIVDAISVMRKEVAEAVDKVTSVINRIIEEKTKEGDKVVIVGVGNTLGVAQ